MEKKVIRTAKSLAFIAMLCLASHGSHAQTFDEWFFQKKTQIKYLDQQIAALAAYMGVLEKGYQIVQKGTGIIYDIKHGDFSLHSDYFGSLMSVKSGVKQSPRIGEIIDLDQRIEQAYVHCYAQVQQDKSFSPDEVKGIYNMYTQLLDQANGNIAELTKVVSDGNIQMTDQQRLSAINRIYITMKGLFNQSQDWLHATAMLSIQRQREVNDAGTVQHLYGIK